MPDTAAVRCFVDTLMARDQKGSSSGTRDRQQHSNAIVLVLDTETTVDEYQNLLFGGSGVWMNGKLKDYYIFHADDLDDALVKVIQGYAARHGYKAMSGTEYVDKVFYPKVLDQGAVCVGFNLPYDISRLAQRVSYSTLYEDGFSFLMTNEVGRPRIAIQSLDSKRAFISFASTMRKGRGKKYRYNRGCFVDLMTTTFALTDNHYSLEKAAVDFGCTLHKTHPATHGVVTEEYIDYNVNDVLLTHELYTRVMDRYKMYCLDKPLDKLYSPASLGKAYLEKIGVKPFMDLNI